MKGGVATFHFSNLGFRFVNYGIPDNFQWCYFQPYDFQPYDFQPYEKK